MNEPQDNEGGTPLQRKPAWPLFGPWQISRLISSRRDRLRGSAAGNVAGVQPDRRPAEQFAAQPGEQTEKRSNSR